MFSGFKDGKAQNVKRPLQMPAVEDSIDTDQERAIHSVITCATLAIQTLDMAFHGPTSCDLA
jgi:hypothetical protein